jgi:hypothetical protein
VWVAVFRCLTDKADPLRRDRIASDPTLAKARADLLVHSYSLVKDARHAGEEATDPATVKACGPDKRQASPCPPSRQAFFDKFVRWRGIAQTRIAGRPHSVHLADPHCRPSSWVSIAYVALYRNGLAATSAPSVRVSVEYHMQLKCTIPIRYNAHDMSSCLVECHVECAEAAPPVHFRLDRHLAAVV